jgi:hypothetical protein
MKRSLAIASALLVFGTAQAQNNALTGEFSLGFATQDIWRGAVIDDNLTFIPMLDLGFGTGTHLTARGSIATDSSNMDEWRFGIHHEFDLIAMSLAVGAMMYEREGGGDTTEIWARAKMKWLTPFTFMIARDIDLVEGTYFRVGTGSGVGLSTPLFGTSAAINWEIWLGYADADFAVYYGSADGGFADAGGMVSATFTVSEATIKLWAKATTLVDPDFTTMTGDRTNVAIGASAGWRF